MTHFFTFMSFLWYLLHIINVKKRWWFAAYQLTKKPAKSLESVKCYLLYFKSHYQSYLTSFLKNKFKVKSKSNFVYSTFRIPIDFKEVFICSQQVCTDMKKIVQKSTVSALSIKSSLYLSSVRTYTMSNTSTTAFKCDLFLELPIDFFLLFEWRVSTIILSYFFFLKFEETDVEHRFYDTLSWSRIEHQILSNKTTERITTHAYFSHIFCQQ